MLKTTRWSPDTCDCVLEYEWDDSLPENQRTHSFKGTVRLCEHHKSLAADKACSAAVSENTRKNIAFGETQKIRPDLTIEDYTWSFEGTGADRKLKVGFLGKLAATEKAAVQAKLDEKFGVGKAEVI